MRLTTLLATGLGTAATAAVGSFASRSALQSWYPKLNKPSYVPPDLAFPIVWTALYADIAVTSAISIDDLSEHDAAEAKKYIAALGTNLVLNAGWSWLFFGAHRLGASAITALALTASSADLARRTAKVSPAAGAALAPYPLWCGFATKLSTDVWRLNRAQR